MKERRTRVTTTTKATGHLQFEWRTLNTNMTTAEKIIKNKNKILKVYDMIPIRIASFSDKKPPLIIVMLATICV